jgi:HSP20 family protein
MALVVRSHRNAWDPFQDLVELQREMSRVFSDAFGATAPARHNGAAEDAWAMPVEIVDRKGELVVRAELPGFRPEDLDVSVIGNTLSIQGQRTQETEQKDEQVVRRELAYGSFYRRLELPQNVNQDALNATYKNGILEITLPKREESKPKQIKVQTQ